MTMKKLEKVLPRYTWAPMLVLIAFHCAVFYVTRGIAYNMEHFDFSIPLDLKIPFVPEFIVFYVLAFAQWGYGMYYLMTHGKKTFYKFYMATMIGEVICFITFIIVPTELCGNVTQPMANGSDVFSFLTRLIYSLDEPNNLFPSLHCFASWLCFRIIFYVEKEKRNTAYTVGSFIFTLLVFASTVFVKQHVAVDILGGVAAVEIAMLTEKLTGAHRLLEKLDDKLFKKDNDPEGN